MIGQGRGVTLESLKTSHGAAVEPTGGRALFTDNIDELHDAFDDLLDELSNQYLLGIPVDQLNPRRNIAPHQGGRRRPSRSARPPGLPRPGYEMKKGFLGIACGLLPVRDIAGSGPDGRRSSEPPTVPRVGGGHLARHFRRRRPGKTGPGLTPPISSVRIDGTQRKVVSAEWVSLVADGKAPPPPPPPDGYSSNESSTGGRLIVLAVDEPNIRFGGALAITKAANTFVDRLGPSDRNCRRRYRQRRAVDAVYR